MQKYTCSCNLFFKNIRIPALGITSLASSTYSNKLPKHLRSVGYLGMLVLTARISTAQETITYIKYLLLHAIVYSIFMRNSLNIISAIIIMTNDYHSMAY